MQVSVVVCGYTLERDEVFIECIESVMSQTYDPVEVVVVVDGNPALADLVDDKFGEAIELVENEENRGISYSRTVGGRRASGDIVAFIDDDAVAEPDWLERLVETFDETDAVAAGGYVAPNWVEGKPVFFPEEFYWLVGCTEKGFATDGEEVRNAYGSNISYRREVFLDIGGYDENTGRKGDRHIQAHEAPVGIRIREAYGRGMIYVVDAVVHHTLFPYRGDFWWLLKRSFWQGFSKRVLDVLYPNSTGSEREFLGRVFGEYFPKRVIRGVRRPTLANWSQIGAILVFTAAIACGYGYGMLSRNLHREE